MPKILIVEDDVRLREFLRERLEEGGYGVSAVGDGVDALEELSRGAIDLIVLDLIMPAARLDGFGFLAQISAHPELRDVPIVILSGVGDLVKEALNPAIARSLRICSVMAKPLDLADVVRTVGDILSTSGRDPSTPTR